MNHRCCLLAVVPILLAGCSDEARPASTPSARGVDARTPAVPPTDPKNILNIALGSKDHKTLVKALKAADYVRGVANPGPLTVFAPTDAAFAKLPAGTLEQLLKPEKADDLRSILKYHVTTSVYEAKDLKDGLQLGMVDLKKIQVRNVNGKVTVNGANVLASIRGSNGVVHVIDGVLLPPK